MTAMVMRALIRIWVAAGSAAAGPDFLMRSATFLAISSVAARVDVVVGRRSIVVRICATTSKSRWNKRHMASIRQFACRHGTSAIPVMDRGPNRERRQPPVPRVMVRARFACNKVFSVFSRPARNAMAPAR